MSKSLNLLLILLLTANFILGVEGCTDSQVTNSQEACIEKKDCLDYVTGNYCKSQCDDSEYAVSATQETPYNNCIPCSKAHVSSDQKTCQETCLTEITQTGQKRCLKSSDDCKLKLSSDKLTCSSSACGPTEISAKPDGKSYFLCQACMDDTKPVPNNDQSACGLCQSPKIADIASHTCLNRKSDCTDSKVILSDGNRCGATCDSNQYQKQYDGYKQCTVCDKTYVSLDKQSCSDTCPLEDKSTQPQQEAPLTNRMLSVICLSAYTDCKGVVSKDLNLCTDTCPDGQVSYEKTLLSQKFKVCGLCADADAQKPLYQKVGNSISCSATCDNNLIQFEDNTCKSIDSCKQMVSSDKKKCKASCPAEEFVSDAVDQKTYKECLKTCTGDGKYHYTLDSVKYCTASCPENMFTNGDECMSSRKDCLTVISNDFKTCAKECDSAKMQTAVQMPTGYKLCVVCDGYFIEKTDKAPSTCLSACPKGQVAVIPTKKCVTNDEAVTACSQLLRSADKTTCSETCIYPDLYDGKLCVNTCPNNTIPDESLPDVKCIESKDCNAKLSSDEKTCVKDCSFIQEQDPVANSKKCQSCGQKVYSYDSKNKANICKDSVTIEDERINLEQQLKESFTNQKAALIVKQSLSKFAGSSASAFGSNKNNTKIIESVELFAQSYLNKMTNILTKNDPQSIGSKTSLMTVFQNVKDHRKPKLALSIKSLLGDTSPDLTEINDTISSPFSNIISSVIASNPACSSENCKYPLVQVKANTKAVRLLADSEPFTVEFEVTKISSNYLCLNYNLETNVVTGKPTTPTISNNGLSVTCTVNGATSLFLDSTCIYLDKSKCSSNQDNSSSSDSDDGLSAGGIVGIVIGSIAFAAIVGVGSFFLYKRLHQSKLEKKESKYIQPPLTTES